ncbi:MAG: hypothetical protein JSS95_03535 [Acidobacteria bacterium]|nr:hypothetical protein [Acidobacteriota bacterium]
MSVVPSASFAQESSGQQWLPDSFWKIATASVFFLASLKGLRFPNRWSATQAQVDYAFGFVKRGFFGASITHWLGLNHYARFTVFSYLVLAVFFAMLVLLIKGSGIAARWGDLGVVALFAGSYSVTYLFNTVGYLEIFSAVLVLSVLQLADSRFRFVGSVAVTIIGLLIHEAFLFMLFPALLLPFVLEWLQEQDRVRRVRLASFIGVLILVAAALAIKIAISPSMSQGQAARMASSIVAKSDFTPRYDFFDVMTRSGRDNLQIMIGYFHSSGWWARQASSIAVFGPTFILLLAASRRILRAALHRYWKYGFAAVCTVSCAPLLMHFVGWDVGRWNGVACLMAFISLLTVARFTQGRPLPVSGRWQRAVLIALLFSMSSGSLLMYGKDDKFFPVLDKFRETLLGLQGGGLIHMVNSGD